MANLGRIIDQKTEKDAQWKEEKQLERQGLADIRDAGIIEITDNPDAYAKYLDMQGENIAYSAGNIAITMFSDEAATKIGTRERWSTLGRTIQDGELDKSIKIFAKIPGGSRGYKIADVYDIRQTLGRPVKAIALTDDSPQMEAALATLLNYAPVPVVTDKKLDIPAFYDAENLEIIINPDCSDSVAFAHIAAEIAHARIHRKGENKYYDRAECEVDAESVSYILCKHFGVAHDLPNVSMVTELYKGWDVQERTDTLNSIHNISKQIGQSIEKAITPQPQRGRGHNSRPTR